MPWPGAPSSKRTPPTSIASSATVKSSAPQLAGGSASCKATRRCLIQPPHSASSRAREHVVEHRLGQPPGERVLLARVVAPEHQVAIELDLRTMGELRTRP